MVAECLIPVSAGEPAQTKLALAVTPDYFQVLGVGARFGRTFFPDDQAVAVLAHGSAADIGRTLRVAGKLYTIIGVAPENFGLDRFLHADFYIPIRSYGDGKILEDRARRFLTVHVRGRNAGAEIASIAERLARQHPETNRGRRAVVLDELTARLRTDKMMPALAALLSSLGVLILGIGCANACGALLMRAESRTRETALKMALGAGHARLLGESLREAGGISVAGCTLGAPLAWAAKEVLLRSVVLPSDFGMSIDARIDGRVAIVVLTAAIVAALLCGLAPAFIGTNAWTVIKARERSARSGVRNALAVVQIALAAALIATGGSLWSGLRSAGSADLGYRTDNIAVMTFDPGQAGYSESRTRVFYRDLMEEVRSLPGVKGVTLAQSVPLGMTGAQKQIRIGDQEAMTVWMNIVTPEYFAQMHIGMVQGRAFDDRDTEVAVVNEELGKRVGVGARMQVGGRTVEVIGIVRTAKYMRWDEAPRPFFYLPYAGNYAPRMTLHVGSAENIFGAVRKLARDVPASDARMLREYFDNGAMFAVKAALRIAAIAGGGGLLLALAGLYGVVSSSVARRRREIGIRVALGADYTSVFAMIVRQGMGLAILGILSGLAMSEYGWRFLRGFVPGGSSMGAAAGAAAVILVTSLIACALPAMRALRVDPAVALRVES